MRTKPWSVRVGDDAPRQHAYALARAHVGQPEAAQDGGGV